MFPLPVDANVVDAPLTGLLNWSRNVIVTVELALPLAVTLELGVAVMVEFAATGGPATNVTVPPDLTTGVWIWRVLISAFCEANVQVETPFESVTLQAV